MIVALWLMIHLDLTNGELRISSGEEVVPHSFPYMVGLFTKSLGRQFLCGGTILDELTIMTSAKCIKGQFSGNILVYVGGHNYEIPEPSDQWMKASKLIPHPGYIGDPKRPHEAQYMRKKVNDVGIIKLQTKIKFSNVVQPATLPLEYQEGDFNRSRKTILGWGAIGSAKRPGKPEPVDLEGEPFLRKATNVYDQQCPSWYGRDLFGKAIVMTSCNKALDDNHQVTNSTSCSKDEGGPFICHVDNVDLICGIISFWWGHPTAYCGTNVLMIATRVTYHLQFIFSYMAERKFQLLPAHGGYYRQLAFVNYQSSPGKMKFLCTAAIVTKRKILTTASCFQGLNTSILLVQVQEKTQGPFKVDGMVVHPLFDKFGPVGKDGETTLIHDIGVLYLESDIVFNDQVHIALLPSYVGESISTTSGYMVGWGTLGYLALSKRTISQAATAMWVIVKLFRCEESVKDTFVCAKGSKPDDLCMADPGAPLIIVQDKKPVVVGLFSHFNSYYCPGSDTIARFTFLAKELLFIIEYTGDYRPIPDHNE